MNRKLKVVAAACIVQYIILNVHAVCDVIIARSCGTLGRYTSTCFGLRDGVVNKFMSESCHMYISFILGSDLGIRILRKLCSDTTTFFFVLQSQLIKLSAIHRWMLNQRCWLSISAEGDNFVFLAIPAGIPAFVCAAHFAPPWSEVCD